MQRPVAVVAITLAVAVTHTIWWHATIVENYCFNGMFLYGVVLLLLWDDEAEDRRYLYYAALLAGLAVFNHIQMMLLLPLGGVYCLLRYWGDVKGLAQSLFVMTLFWLAGAAPWLGLLVRDSGDGQRIEQATHAAFGAQFTAIMFDLQPARLWPIVQHEVAQQMPHFTLLLIPIGILVGLWRSQWRVHVALGVGFLVNTGFFLTYHTWDRYAFLLPSVAIAWLWGLEAWAWFLDLLEGRDKRLRWAFYALLSSALWLPPWYHLQQVQWARDGGFGHGRFSGNSHWNSHDVGRYVAWPVKSEWDDIDVMIRLMMEQLPQNAIWIDDDARTHYTFDFYFRAMNGMRQDVTCHIINAWGFDNWGLPVARMISSAPSWINNGRRVFTSSTHSPHREWQIEMAKQGLVTQRFDLDESHWVYELVRTPNPGAEPQMLEVETGLRLRSLVPLLTHRVGTDDSGQIRIRYMNLSQERQVEIIYEHTDLAHREVVTLGANSQRRVFELPESVASKPGRWRVQVVAAGIPLSHASITVEPGTPDRRWR